MTQLFIIKDKTDNNYKKPFVSIHRKKEDAEQKVAQLRHKISAQNQHLIQYENVEVADYDKNKESIYIVFDKSDKNNMKPFISMHSDYRNATEVITRLRKKVPDYAQKLVYTAIEKVS